MELLIKGGTVVTASESFQADLAVDHGKIQAIGKHLELEAEHTVDASGKLVLPGAIDAHTHMQMPFGGTVSADSYLSGTRAAVCGGVTTIFDYPVQHRGETILGLIHSKKEICETDACCDYAFHCCITDFNGGAILDEMEAAVEAGITSFKCFLVYKKEGMMVDDGMLATLLLRGRELGAMINVHAENPDLIDLRTAQYLKEGKTSAWYHYMSRPEFVAAEADKRTVHWATHLNTPVYLVHMSDQEGLEAVIQAKNQGYPVYVETCPQYLEFTCDVYRREDGRNFVCSPPMKGEESRQALWKALQAGYIDTVATDHCPFQQAEKDWGLHDFSKIPNGCAGVENLYPYMLDAANTGKITFERAVEVCAANPAKIFGCAQKGSLAVGKDADIVIYDPKEEVTVSMENMHSDYDHTIWEGHTFHGYPVQTYLRGRLVYDHGVYVGKPGDGRFVRRIAGRG
ncbi:MAG: dihydropyrimidinase [Lachnospiraceae bacterium]|jgi:dihydropyrimidinase|nr:dihydropyrimidinase [Lachnospiraceae bacterium]MCI1657947.1 dihydropyrimidinase [Lachnospiraceae bacterium]